MDSGAFICSDWSTNISCLRALGGKPEPQKGLEYESEATQMPLTQLTRYVEATNTCTTTSPLNRWRWIEGIRRGSKPGKYSKPFLLMIQRAILSSGALPL